MSRSRIPSVALPLSFMMACVLLWPAESFVFAGLSPRTTLEILQKRYPHSTITGGHVYVSAADSHDHIYGIDLPGGAGSPTIRIFFERRGRKRNEYPRCGEVEAVIKRQYGDPAVVEEFEEEQARNRRLLWRRGKDDLSLLCFQMGRQPLFAAELTITSGR